MMLQYQLHKILLVAATMIMITSAMKCDKLILTSGSVENTGATSTTHLILETGQYLVTTTLYTRSSKIQKFIKRLNGASDIQYSAKSFTATLVPKDLKKLCRSGLVESIKMVKLMDISYKCQKVIRGRQDSVILSSYIVMMKSNSNMSELMTTINSATNDMDSSVIIEGVREFHSSKLHGVFTKMNHEGVDMMCKQPYVDYIEEDQMIYGESQTSQWNLDRIDQRFLPLNRKYSPRNNGAGVDIFVLDTGINFDHSEFQGRAKFDNFDPYDEATGSNQRGRDCHGHGTYVAALVAGRTVGAANAARVFSTRILSCDGVGSSSILIDGINHVIAVKSSNRARKIIINISVGGPISVAELDAVRAATNEGILVVVSAGNSFTNAACSRSPASSPFALTVGGTRQGDKLLYRSDGRGTNFGRCVDIFAPGQDVRSASFTSPTSFATHSGTSVATPLVSGAAAIYWNYYSNAGAEQLKKIMISKCTKNKIDLSEISSAHLRRETPNCLLFVFRIPGSG